MQGIEDAHLLPVEEATEEVASAPEVSAGPSVELPRHAKYRVATSTAERD